MLLPSPYMYNCLRLLFSYSVLSEPKVALLVMSDLYLEAGGFFPYTSAISLVRLGALPQHRPMYWTPIALASSANVLMSLRLHLTQSKSSVYTLLP